MTRPTGGNSVKGVGTKILNESHSGGVLRGIDGKKTQVLFDLTYTKSGSNPQGQVTILVKSEYLPNGTKDGRIHVYLIKSNAISTLSVNKSSAETAVFTSKASVIDITDLTNVKSVDGGALLKMMAIDGNGTAGIGDKIGVEVNNAKTGGLWFSSYWDGTRTQPSSIVQDGKGDVLIN